MCSRFQFHKGTIRTLVVARGVGGVLDFNSIKVQLERGVLRVGSWCPRFQFHKGTIRTLQA